MGTKTENKSKPNKPTKKSILTKEKPKSLKKESQEEFTRLFLEYYLGWHEAECFGNATYSYLMAKGNDFETVKELSRPLPVEEHEAINGKDVETGEEGTFVVKRRVYHSTYNVARVEGWRLLTKPSTKIVKSEMLQKLFKDPNRAKNRHVELAEQNKNIIVARQANADILKMTGELEDKQTVNIPQLMELTDKIGGILKKK